MVEQNHKIEPIKRVAISKNTIFLPTVHLSSLKYSGNTRGGTNSIKTEPKKVKTPIAEVYCKTWSPKEAKEKGLKTYKKTKTETPKIALVLSLKIIDGLK